MPVLADGRACDLSQTNPLRAHLRVFHHEDVEHVVVAQSVLVAFAGEVVAHAVSVDGSRTVGDEVIEVAQVDVVIVFVQAVVPKRAGRTSRKERLTEQGDRRSGSDAGPVPDPAGESCVGTRCPVAAFWRAPYEMEALVTT